VGQAGTLFIFVGGAVLLLMIGMFFIQSSRIALLSRRLDHLTQGEEGQSLEEVLGSHLQTVLHVASGLEEVAARTAVLEGASRLHFSRLGLVRFNPFDDTGGNQSFAMAMLDANNDGFVISSLHSRTGTRIYAKAIFEGVCESPLSTEEEKAVGIAVSQGGAVPAASQEAAPTPVGPGKKVTRQRSEATAGKASTASLAKPAAPRPGRKAGTAPKAAAAAAAQVAVAESEAAGTEMEVPQA
jgi:hypothetical protein